MFDNLFSSSSSFIELGQVGVKSSAVEILPTDRMALLYVRKVSLPEVGVWLPLWWDKKGPYTQKSTPRVR